MLGASRKLGARSSKDWLTRVTAISTKRRAARPSGRVWCGAVLCYAASEASEDGSLRGEKMLFEEPTQSRISPSLLEYTEITYQSHPDEYS